MADDRTTPRPWFAIADDVKATRRLLEIGTMSAMCASLEDEEWERLLTLMEEADDLS
jgi:hypothetical protein